MSRIYPIDIVVGGVGGLAGFYFGLSKGLTILLVTTFSLASFGIGHLVRRSQS